MSWQRLRLSGAISWRFLRGRHSRLLDGTALSALVAVTLGVAAMVVAMALMSGYRHSLERKLTGGNAAVMIFPLTEEGASDPAVGEALRAAKGVEDVRRVVYGQGSLASRARPRGVDVALRGVEGAQRLRGLGNVSWSGSPNLAVAADGVARALAGRELAARLAVEPGEVLRLTVLGTRQGRPRFRYRSLHLAGTFQSGFSEFDGKLLVLEREALAALTGAAIGDAVFEVALTDAGAAAAVAATARDRLGEEFLVMDWRDMNRELFTALKVQRIALFFVLGLIVLVSTFNVASSLVVLVRDRLRDVGVLAALGLGPADLSRLFLFYGGGLSAAGVAAGVGIGAAASWVMTRYELIRFEPEMAQIYFLSSVPLEVELLDVAAVAGFTLAVTAIACWVPARRAARIEPARALRYE